MYAILSVIEDSTRNETRVSAELLVANRGFTPAERIHYDEQDIIRMINFGAFTTFDYKKLAVLNYHVQQGLRLAAVDTHDTTMPKVIQTDYYLEISPKSKYYYE